jgi:hypothetical protein
MSIDPRIRRSYDRVVSQAARAAGSDPVVDDLLPLALARPHEALAKARALLAGHPGSHAASVAHQVAGIVARDHGDAQEAVRESRAALRLARRAGSAEREADVLATLGTALVVAGRTAAGLVAFDQALQGNKRDQEQRQA